MVSGHFACAGELLIFVGGGSEYDAHSGYYIISGHVPRTVRRGLHFLVFSRREWDVTTSLYQIFTSPAVSKSFSLAPRVCRCVADYPAYPGSQAYGENASGSTRGPYNSAIIRFFADFVATASAPPKPLLLDHRPDVQNPASMPPLFGTQSADFEQLPILAIDIWKSHSELPIQFFESGSPANWCCSIRRKTSEVPKQAKRMSLSYATR